MAMTNAERQRAYRPRHLADVDGQWHRLNLVVSVQAGGQLDELAQHCGVTKRALLEQPLQQAELI